MLGFYKKVSVIILLGFYSPTIQSQDTAIGNKIVGNGDAANYYIGHFPVFGSDGLDLHWYGGIRFGDSTSNSVMQIAGGNVGIGTTNPRANLDVAKDISNGQLGTVFGRLPEGDGTGLGTYLGVKGYATQGSNDVKSFSIVHDFHGITNNSINFYRGGGMTGGFMSFCTNDNIEKMRIGANGYVGIGTTTPAAKLDIVGDIYIDNLDWSTDNALRIREGSSNSYGAFFKYGLNDLLTIGTRHIDSDYVAFQIPRGSTNVTFNGNVGIGSTNPDSKLTVKGKIHAEEVKIDLAVPADYVFEKYYLGKSSLKPDYTLLTLAEVEKFTEENHHLPNVPSAKEIKENGLMVGEMSNVLLQKIEELTLYAIKQEKKNNEQAENIKNLDKQIELLKIENEAFKLLSERLSKLENQSKQ